MEIYDPWHSGLVFKVFVLITLDWSYAPDDVLVLLALAQTIREETSRLIFNRSIVFDSVNQILRTVECTLMVQNILRPEASPTARSNSYFTLENLAPEMLMSIAEAIQQSNIEVGIEQVRWTVVVDPRSLERGGGISKTINWEKSEWNWIKSFEKETYKEQLYQGQKINCGAFCIAFLTKKRGEAINVTRRRAFEIHTQNNFESYVTPEKLGHTFINLFPDYRLVILNRNVHATHPDYIYRGVNWEPVKKKIGCVDTSLHKSVYISYLPLQQHFGVVQSPTRFYDHRVNTYSRFCHECVTRFSQTGTCRCKDRETKRAKVKKPCVNCTKVSCNGKCENLKCIRCNSLFKKIGYEMYKHRCLVLDETKPKVFLPAGEQPNFKQYRVYAFDFEARMQIVEGEKSIKFETSDHEFTENVPVYKLEGVKQHVVNLVVFRDIFDPSSEIVLEGDDCLERFIDIVTTENKGRNICVAHNASGYDSRLIFDCLVQKFNATPKFIKNGTKFMEIKHENTFFRDSMLFLPGSLANLAKDYQLPMRKGYFPHLFNTIENYDYEGELPPQKYYDLTFMAKTSKAVDDFKIWHSQRKQEGPWNFRKEIIAYCRDDVKILAEIMTQFHEICVAMNGESPWHYVTGPKYVHQTILKSITASLNLPDDKIERGRIVDHLARNEKWAALLPVEYNFAREAMRGGKTDVRRIHYKLSDEDIAVGRKIVYQDIVSMYPFVQVARQYPVGIPTIHIYDKTYFPCHRCMVADNNNQAPASCICTPADDSYYEHYLHIRRKNVDPRLNIIECYTQPDINTLCQNPTFFGVVCATIIPPKNLFHPVLVHYDEKRKKSVASLEKKTGVFVSVEFQEAIRQGYVCEKIHRYDEYKKAPGLWNPFLKNLYIQKMANSKPTPPLDEQERLVRRHKEIFGEEYANDIRKSFARWGFNPAARSVFKGLLNCGWGKQCQRPILPRTLLLNHTRQGDTDQWYNTMEDVHAGKMVLKNYEALGDNFTFIRTEDDPTPANRKKTHHDNYLPAGIFVPAYGRLMLLEQLTKLGKRVLYHDTDSIIYIYDPNLYNIPEEDIWGCWEEEKISKQGITEFISTGPKSYALKTETSELVKLKGLSIKHSHRHIINFASIKNLIFNALQGFTLNINVPQFRFLYTLGKGMKTIEFIKQLKFDPNELKGDLKDDLYVYPFGYEE